MSLKSKGTSVTARGATAKAATLVGGPVDPAMVEDARRLRKIVVKALEDYQAGKISNDQAHKVSMLAKRILDAMKIEYLAGPPMNFQALAAAEDDGG